MPPAPVAAAADLIVAAGDIGRKAWALKLPTKLIDFLGMCYKLLAILR
jgi:hypothetical protein